MDPLIIYILLFTGAVSMLLAATAAYKTPMRSCLACGEDTPVQGRRCRHCGYRPGRPV